MSRAVGDHLDAQFLGPGGGEERIVADDPHFQGHARVATAWPMRPRPMIPSVLPANCVPMNFFRSQRFSTRL